MLSLSMLFILMMLPGLAVLATSLIVSFFEKKQGCALHDKCAG